MRGRDESLKRNGKKRINDRLNLLVILLNREDVISVLEKRKQGDLVKHLNEELAKKDER